MNAIALGFSRCLKNESKMTFPATTRLLPSLRQHFNLSQPALGKCLGLSRTMVSQVERGIRGLPLPAALPQAALTLAWQNVPAEPAPETVNTTALRKHQRAAELRANQLDFELSQLPTRAAWARRRLAALPILTAALAPVGTPAWLASFAAEAHAELLRSGSTAQARLRMRIAGLRAEVAAATLELDAATLF
jgi:transcriptional regulator with XRE-family HTH domain